MKSQVSGVARRFRSVVTPLAVAFGLAVSAAGARAEGVCGVFLLDASGSISDGQNYMDRDGRHIKTPYNAAADERRIQKQGYIDAFNDPRVQAAITGRNGKRKGAFSFMQYGSNVKSFSSGLEGNGWSVVDRETLQSGAMQDNLANSGVYDEGLRTSTLVFWALRHAIDRVLSCPLANPDKRFIDVSGDGIDGYLRGYVDIVRGDKKVPDHIKNMVSEIEAMIEDYGIQVNGLVLPVQPSEPAQEVYDFYDTYIKQGSGAQTFVARSWSDFPEILRKKMILEFIVSDMRELPRRTARPAPG